MDTRTTLRILLAAITTATTLGAQPHQPVPATRLDESPVVRVYGADANARALVDWAIDRFAQIGVEFNDLDIRFSADKSDCSTRHGAGGLGRYRRSTRTVYHCNVAEANTSREHTLLHELAHAWSFTEFDRDKIDQLLAARDLEHWHGGGAAWWELGSEHVADIVAWGLFDRAERIEHLVAESCDELRRLFELLTGHEPLHDHRSHCVA